MEVCKGRVWRGGNWGGLKIFMGIGVASRLMHVDAEAKDDCRELVDDDDDWRNVYG